MKTRIIRVAIAVPWIVVGAAVVAAQSRVQITGVYSDLRYNAQGGDLLGMEVFIVVGPGGYFATVQCAGGEPPKKLLAVVTAGFTRRLRARGSSDANVARLCHFLLVIYCRGTARATLSQGLTSRTDEFTTLPTPPGDTRYGNTGGSGVGARRRLARRRLAFPFRSGVAAAVVLVALCCTRRRHLCDVGRSLWRSVRPRSDDG